MTVVLRCKIHIIQYVVKSCDALNQSSFDLWSFKSSCVETSLMTYPHGLSSRRMRPALVHQCTCSFQIPEASACRAEHGASSTLVESRHRHVVHPRWPRVDTQSCGRDGMAALIMESKKRTYGPVTMFPFILAFSLFSRVNILHSRVCFVVALLLPQQRDMRALARQDKNECAHFKLAIKLESNDFFIFLYREPPPIHQHVVVSYMKTAPVWRRHDQPQYSTLLENAVT